MRTICSIVHTVLGLDIQSLQSELGMAHECPGWFHEVTSKYLQNIGSYSKRQHLFLPCFTSTELRKQ